MKAQRDKQVKDVAILRAQRDKQKDMIADLRAQRSKQIDEMTILKARCEKQSHEIAMLIEQRDKQSDEIDRINAQFDRQTHELKSLEARVALLSEPIFQNKTARQQRSNVSYLGRHAKILQSLKAYFDSKESAPKKILSFGCSRGFECIDLSRYFPKSKVYGCDIDENVLKEAKENVGDDITIFYSSTTGFEENGPFDMVVAFNVLCQYPASYGMDDICEVYSFDSYDAILSLLDRYITPNGALVIYNAAYFFEDSTIAKRYKASNIGSSNNGWIEKSSKGGKRVCDVSFELEGEIYSRDDYTALTAEYKKEGKNLNDFGEIRLHYIDGYVSPNSLEEIMWFKES